MDAASSWNISAVSLGTPLIHSGVMITEKLLMLWLLGMVQFTKILVALSEYALTDMDSAKHKCGTIIAVLFSLSSTPGREWSGMAPAQTYKNFENCFSFTQQR